MRAMMLAAHAVSPAALGNRVPGESVPGVAPREDSAPLHRLLSVLLALSLVAARAAVVAAHPGDLDPSFGTGGLVTSDVGAMSQANAVAVQTDGKIVAAGSTTTANQPAFALARYNPDGSLDATFGTGGKVDCPRFGGRLAAFAISSGAADSSRS
jgi:uncharacterized delta-60 repeat protein